MAKYSVISFLSDMGTADEAVGVCKSIMNQQAPHALILDITHEIAPFDVRAGALALTRAIQFLPKGVVVAAIDPGIPRDQRYIAVEMETGVFIGPDNGILAPAVQLIGTPSRVHEITNPDYKIEAPGGIFSARDILAPAAGVVAAGTDIKELGNAIPLEQLVPGMLQLSRHDEGGAFLGEVWSIDRFGNVQLNVTPEELISRGVNYGDTLIVRCGDQDFMALFVQTYADLAVSQLGVLVDSTGMVSVVKNLSSAANELGAKEGKAIAILPNGTSVTGRDVTVEEVVGSHEQVSADALNPLASLISQQPVDPSPSASLVGDFLSASAPENPTNPLAPQVLPTNPEQPAPNSFGSMPSSNPLDAYTPAPQEHVSPHSIPPVAPSAPADQSGFGSTSFGQPVPEPSAPVDPASNQSLGSILNSGQMPSTFSQEPVQEPGLTFGQDPTSPFMQPQPAPEVPTAPVAPSYPVAPAPAPTAPPAAPAPPADQGFGSSVFGQPAPAPIPDPLAPHNPESDATSSEPFSGNVFDLFKSDEDPTDEQNS